MPRTPYARRSAPLPIDEHHPGPSALLRTFRIHERLARGRPVTAVSLARELEVSARTIKRDIEALRNHYGAPIAWDAARQTYAYEREFDFLPLLRLGADEALALELAGATFAAWRGTPLGAALLSALDKIAHVTAGAVSVPAVDVAALIHDPAHDLAGDAERRWFAVTLEAIRRRRVLRLAYRNARASAPHTRTVHPLHLAHLDHRWVLIAFDPVRSALRTFVLARIHDARVTAHHFTPPGDFDIRAHLAGSIGRFAGSETFDVRIAFDPVVAPYLRERPWHASQTIIEKPDGSIETTFRLNNLIDIQRRVLACGRHAEVLAPRELREAIRAEARALAARYEKSSGPGGTGTPDGPPPVLTSCA